MLAQVVLTTAESKKLIAKAVASMDEVKHAAAEGMVVAHPSSATYFIVHARVCGDAILTGRLPETLTRQEGNVQARTNECFDLVPRQAVCRYGAEELPGMGRAGDPLIVGAYRDRHACGHVRPEWVVFPGYAEDLGIARKQHRNADTPPGHFGQQRLPPRSYPIDTAWPNRCA